MGRSIGIIVLLQALGALVLVTAGVYLVTQSTPTALVFGAIAMATAPAATVDVLAEYGAEGPHDHDAAGRDRHRRRADADRVQHRGRAGRADAGRGELSIGDILVGARAMCRCWT